ncbi:MAG: hypothetical protein AAF604_07390 [Acidobacteriota bacterium]
MRRFTGFCAGVVLLSALVACGPSVEEQAATALEGQWVAVQEAKSALDQMRQELADLKAAAETTVEGAEEATEEVTEEAAAASAAAIAELEQKVDDTAGEFNQQLVDFINSDPPVEGEARSERQNAAFAMKSDEDILVAQEYINVGGDYKRAISIYEQAMTADPENARLQELLAEAQELRFMSEERFGAVKKGMTEEEVRASLGPVNLRNVREYEDKGATAWFYPKDDQGSAAAVWFRRAGQEAPLKVYDINFEALKGQQGEG